MKRRKLSLTSCLNLLVLTEIYLSTFTNAYAASSKLVEEENILNHIETDDAHLGDFQFKSELDTTKRRERKRTWDNWLKLDSKCKSGYLEGVCTFALECIIRGGYSQDTCKLGFFSIGVCCTNSTTLSAVNVKNEPNITNECGEQKLFGDDLLSRVVNGKEGYYGQFPWTASMRLQFPLDNNVIFSQHYCGSVLLSHSWVVTTAHCVFTEAEGFGFTVLRFGETREITKISNEEEYPYEERKIKRAFIHPNFKRETFHSDIALLKLDRPIEFRPNIQPICLPGNKDQLDGRTGVVSGWGRVGEDNDDLPDMILMADLPIMTNDECEEIFRKGNYSENISNAKNVYLCAGYEDGHKDACTGDSGGPLQLKAKDNKIFLGGIISWGYGCSRKYKPGVYTRISEFVPWILDIMRNY